MTDIGCHDNNMLALKSLVCRLGSIAFTSIMEGTIVLQMEALAA